MDSGAWQAKVPGVTKESDTTEATFVVVQSLSCVRLFVTPWTVAHQAHPWTSPGKNTGVGCHFLLQGIFPTQGSNPGLLHCGRTLPNLEDLFLNEA